jgi:putative hydrolase of HD superfamily
MLSTLIELQRLKTLERTGWTLRGMPNGTESVAAHSFGVSVTAMLLADELKSRGVTLDLERVLKMALVHDWAEARIGDMPKTATDYFGTNARKSAETRAFIDIVNSTGSKKLEYETIFQEYEDRNSVEARLVKAADVIDLLIQAYALEHAGARGLDEFWEVAEQVDFLLSGEADAVVREVLQAVLDARGKIGS